MSLPIRERGLKRISQEEYETLLKSLPIRERGLKHLRWIGNDWTFLVAPNAGAWIETLYFLYFFLTFTLTNSLMQNLLKSLEILF